jgi:lipid-binding SYLF domain-containing protein
MTTPTPLPRSLPRPFTTASAVLYVLARYGRNAFLDPTAKSYGCSVKYGSPRRPNTLPTHPQLARLTHVLRVRALGWACPTAIAAYVLMAAAVAAAASAQDIDRKVDAAIERFEAEVGGGHGFIQAAKGILVFPSVVKAGFGIGGEYGTGALRINGKTTDYYSTTAASVGFQIGAQTKTIILCFMTDTALSGFRKSRGWEIGVDGSVVVVDLGAGGSLDTTTAPAPVVGFVFGQSGLMANISLEGAKITKIHPE